MGDTLYLKIEDDYNGTIRLLEVDGPATIYFADGVRRFCKATGFDVAGAFTPIGDFVWMTRPQYRAHRGIDLTPFCYAVDIDSQFESF